MTREQHLEAKVERLRAALERLIVAAEALEDVDETDRTARIVADVRPQ